MSQVASALHHAADGGDKDRTKRELKKLDGLLRLIQGQYPEGMLEHQEPSSQAAPSETPGRTHSDGGGDDHAAMRPKGLVDAPPEATIYVRALDMRFEPRTFEIRAGVPTRIELENKGATEHSFVVKTPSGEDDWIHLHAKRGASDAGVYRLERAGRYPILCTTPGHSEAGMVGELVVRGGAIGSGDREGQHGEH